MDGRIAAALEEARRLERHARRLVLLSGAGGAEGAAQALAAGLEGASARSRSAVLARLERGDVGGALGVARALVEAVRARGLELGPGGADDGAA